MGSRTVNAAVLTATTAMVARAGAHGTPVRRDKQARISLTQTIAGAEMNVSPLVRGAAKVAMFSAAFAIPGTGMAYAGTTSGAGSVGGGNQINAPVSVPVNVC